jgi:hypothetical protein
MISALFLALLCCGTISARPRHWYSDPKFWIGEAVIVGSTYADARTTCNGFGRGYVEGNPLDRGAHNCGAAIGILSIGTGIYTGLHIASYRMLQDDTSKAWRGVSLVTVPAIAFGFDGVSAIRNARKIHTGS